MKLYRYVNEQELQAHLSGDWEQFCTIQESQEPFTSNPYLKFSSDENYYAYVRHDMLIHGITDNSNYYLCEFNIPITLALPGRGYKDYQSPFFLDDPIKLREFKIPVSKLRPNYLTRYALDKSRDKKWTEALNVDVVKSIAYKGTKNTPSDFNDLDDYKSYLQALINPTAADDNEDTHTINN